MSGVSAWLLLASMGVGAGAAYAGVLVGRWQERRLAKVTARAVAITAQAMIAAAELMIEREAER